MQTIIMTVHENVRGRKKLFCMISLEKYSRILYFFNVYFTLIIILNFEANNL